MRFFHYLFSKYGFFNAILSGSRAHTIVAISFSQKGANAAGQMMTKTSIVNLVDLAGRLALWFPSE